ERGESAQSEGCRGVDRLRRGNRVLPAGKFQIKQRQRLRADVGSVRGNRDSAVRSRQAAKQTAQGRSCTRIGERRCEKTAGAAASDSVGLAGALVGKEEQ